MLTSKNSWYTAKLFTDSFIFLNTLKKWISYFVHQDYFDWIVNLQKSRPDKWRCPCFLFTLTRHILWIYCLDLVISFKTRILLDSSFYEKKQKQLLRRKKKKSAMEDGWHKIPCITTKYYLYNMHQHPEKNLIPL